MPACLSRLGNHMIPYPVAEFNSNNDVSQCHVLSYVQNSILKRLISYLYIQGVTKRYGTNFRTHSSHLTKVQCRIHKGSPIIPILSRINPIPRTDTYLFKVHSNIFLPPTPRSPQGSLSCIAHLLSCLDDVLFPCT